MIYRDIHDRQQTQLAQRIASWPGHTLTEAAKKLVRYSRQQVLTKQAFSSLVVTFDDTPYIFYGRTWHEVRWAYGIIPTKQEWESAAPDKLMNIEYRNSPAIAGRYVAIISWRS